MSPAPQPVPVRRMKTYTGAQGYVYQYYFVGQRTVGAATEYIFDVTSDRKTTFAVSVFLSNDSLRHWASRHGRVLNEAEQYAAVKMRLFQAFDEVEDMLAQGRTLHVDQPDLEALLAGLGID